MSAFGRYGVIRESDYHSKRAEFVKWAMDIKRIDTESLNRTEEMKLFADFAEDYNTGRVFAHLFANPHHHVSIAGTLPHLKYYDLDAYHRKKKSKKASKKKDAIEDYHFNDEEERRKEKERKKLEDHQRRIQEAYHELQTTEKASVMKQQVIIYALWTTDHASLEVLCDRNCCVCK